MERLESVAEVVGRRWADDVGVGGGVAVPWRSHCYWLGGEGLVGWDYCCTIGVAAGVDDGAAVAVAVAVAGGDAGVGADGGVDAGGAAMLDGIADCGHQYQSTDG